MDMVPLGLMAGAAGTHHDFGVMPALSGRFVFSVRFGSHGFPLFVAPDGFRGCWQRVRPAWLWMGLQGRADLPLLWRFVNCRWGG